MSRLLSKDDLDVVLGRGDKIRAFHFSPLLDYVLGLCDVMDVKEISIKSK